MPLFGRLRTQIILSHLVAIAFTLIAMVAAVVLIVGGWFARQQGSFGEPTQQARTVASAIGGLVARGDTPDDLNVVLRLLARGDLGVPAGPAAWAPQSAQSFAQYGNGLHDDAYIVVVGPDGQPLASSEAAGAAFAPPERDRWGPLVRAALGGAHDPRQLEWVQPGAQPAALGAYPVINYRGQPIAAVVVASSVAPPTDQGSGFLHRLVIFGAALAAVLTAASVFALVAASIVGFFLARRLVARLERLGRAVEALASGDLSQHVEEGPLDEVGQLARRFNVMATRLAATVAELAAAKEHTESALRAKRELVASVSHELRTPLALIRGHVESLIMGKGDADSRRQREYLGVIERETENLSHLIDDLFAISTAETGALQLELEPFSLGEVVKETASSIQPVARRERRITVLVSVAPNLPLVLADRRRVGQVLGNLIRNALRYTPEGGLIALRTEREDGHVTLSVEDTGEGISPDRLPHVFERFYRGDAARDRASGGAGLGLAIVRELVEAMGGDVSVESTVGQGSRFFVRLPLASDPAELSAVESG